MSVNSSHTILMLEGDPDDRFLTSLTFKEKQYPVHIEFVNAGDELFSWLGLCTKTKMALPSLIIITLTAATSDGITVLQQLKNKADLRHIPVVMLTGYTDNAIVRECYALGATSVIEKPSGSQATNDKIDNFFRYWFETVALH